VRRIAAFTTLISLAAPAVAGAQSPSPGGVQAPGTPTISAVVCADGHASHCERGSELRIVGENLNGVERVRFLGGPGRADDRIARPQQAAPEELSVVVPKRTRSGPIELRGWSGSARVASIRITTTAPSTADQNLPDAPAGDAVFPVRGAHEYGTSINGFGGGRGHQGQDVFAACGTPLVAAMAGEVIKATFQSRAGNYIVIQHADGRSTAYMHMRRPATLQVGDQVQAGDPIGEVGETGRASGCHLHFELWTAPGWYRGGRPIDPLSTLRAMDARRAKTN
jgi:murein DD-endopeptidase MepM/ murein hydrolase activator NlpD